MPQGNPPVISRRAAMGGMAGLALAPLAARAAREGKTRYTASRGIPQLREAAAGRLRERNGMDVTAGQVKLDSALVNCTGVVKCKTLQTSSVISNSYTPGVGNVW